MSIQAMTYVFQHSPAKAGARLVLLSLANHANDLFLSWPAVQTIAHECRMDERSVQRSLRRLEADAEVEAAGSWSRGGRKATTYRLIRCIEVLNPVGVQTGETPYANRTQRQGLPHANASNRHKWAGIPRHNATPPPALRHPTPGVMPPHPRQNAGAPPANGRGESARFVTPPPASDAEYPGVMPPDPLEPKSEPTISNPAPPPQAAVDSRGQGKELADRKEIEARDRRERFESQGVARDRRAPDRLAAEVNVGAYRESDRPFCNFCCQRFSQEEFDTHQCQQKERFYVANGS